MANPIDQTMLNAVVAAVMQQLQSQGASPKAASQPIAKGEFDPVRKDQWLRNSFARRGFKDVVLMDRSDKSKPYNIRPYRGWIEQGRRVRKGEHGVRGLFHISQTDVIADTKPGMSPDRKAMFRKAKAKLHPVT